MFPTVDQEQSIDLFRDSVNAVLKFSYNVRSHRSHLLIFSHAKLYLESGLPSGGGYPEIICIM